MSQLKVQIILDIEESQVSNQGIADLVVRGAINSLQQAGGLGLIKANITGGVIDDEGQVEATEVPEPEGEWPQPKG